MPNRFAPKRTPLPDVALDARLRHIEDWLSNLGGSGTNPNTVNNSPAPVSSGAGAGGGGSASTILAGDVTGPLVTNTLSFLQGTPLDLSAVGEGDLLTFNGADWINDQFLTGNYTLTGLLDSAVLSLKPAGAASAGGVLAVDDFSNNGLLVVQARADLDPGFHPVTVDVAGNQTGKSAMRVQSALGATAPTLLVNALDGLGNTAAQAALEASGELRLSLADSVASSLQPAGSVKPIWQVNTDGSQQGGLSFVGFDHATGTGREFLRGIADGAAPAIGFFGAAPVEQIGGAVDVLAGLVSLGLRGSSSNPPLDLGSGSITAGSSTFTAPAGGRCLTLNAQNAATLFIQPAAGTHFSNYLVNGILQWVTDAGHTGAFDITFQNLGNGQNFLAVDNSGIMTCGPLNGVILGAAAGKAGFYGTAPSFRQTVSGVVNGNPALRSLMNALGLLGLVTDSTKATDPNAVSFSWVNQGGATVTAGDGTTFLQAPAVSPDQLRCRVIAAPSPPYTITIGFLPMLLNVNFNLCGICLRDSTGGGLVTLAYTNNGGVLTNAPCITATKWTNFSTFSANYTLSPNPVPAVNWMAGACLWLRIKDDGANRTFCVSNDGANFTTILSTTNTDFITATQIGWFVDVNNASYGGGMLLLSWSVA